MPSVVIEISRDQHVRLHQNFRVGSFFYQVPRRGLKATWLLNSIELATVVYIVKSKWGVKTSMLIQWLASFTYEVSWAHPHLYYDMMKAMASKSLYKWRKRQAVGLSLCFQANMIHAWLWLSPTCHASFFQYPRDSFPPNKTNDTYTIKLMD